MTSVQLAQLSNSAVYMAMGALTFAMFLFAASYAAGRRRARDIVAEGSQTIAEESGGVAVLTVTEVVDIDEPGRRSANIGMALTWLACGLLLIGVVLRGMWAGRVPWGNMYEFSLTGAFCILAVFLGISTRRDLRWLGLFVVTPTLLWLGLAVTVLYTEAAQLVPALHSYWLIIHVSAAVICFGAFTVAAATGALSLVRRHKERTSAEVRGWAARLPSADRLETLTYRTIAFSFPLWTFVVVAGAIWAEAAWGRYWGWDPKETWAFITWVIYAAYLHARSTAGWAGSRATWISLLGYAAFLFNYFGVNLFLNSIHSYAGVS